VNTNATLHETKKYSDALVMGKFMPIHLGHVALVRHALAVAAHVTVAIVAKEGEPIPLPTRLSWFEAIFETEIAKRRLRVTCFEHALPHDGSYHPEHVKAWCQEIASRFSGVDAFVSSESYGDVLAAYMHIDHLIFDISRDAISVSGTAIRENPRAYRAYLPDIVADYYGLSGTKHL